MNKIIWTSRQLNLALQLNINEKNEYGAVCFNSKVVKKGDIFIALTGGNRDGHEFVEDAFKQGASLAILERKIPGVDSDKCIVVADTFAALESLAEFKRNKSNAKFIAITGSAGKTSTKEALKLMLSEYGEAYANSGSFNNKLGVALTLASMPSDAEFAIIEMGMNAPGELSELSNSLVPDIAIITTVSEGHIGFFNSVEEIADAKCEIFEGLDINEGIAIINKDIETYDRCVEHADNNRLTHVKTFGSADDSDIKFLSYDVLEGDHVRLSYEINNETIEFVMHSIPQHLAANFAACFASVVALDLDIDLAVQAIAKYTPFKGRGELVKLSNNNANYMIICDYYNSNPQSMQASLIYLKQFENKNKMAILGGINELGKYEDELHMKMIPYINESGISKLITIGEAMKKISSKIDSKIDVQCYSSAQDVIKDVESFVEDDQVILIKGSRSYGLEKVAITLGVKDAL